MNKYTECTCNDLISEFDNLKKDMDNKSDLYEIVINLIAITNAIKLGCNTTKSNEDISILNYINHIYHALEKEIHSKLNTNKGDETMTNKGIPDDFVKGAMFKQACVNLLQRYKNLSEAAGRHSITEVQAKCYQNMSVLNTIMYDNSDWNWEMYNIIYKAYDSISKEFMTRSYEKNDEYFNNKLRNYVNEKKDEELNNKMHEKKNEYAGNKLYNYTKEYTYQKYNIDVTNKIIEEHRNKRKEYKKQMLMYKEGTVEYEYYNKLQTFEKFFINALIISQNNYSFESIAKKFKLPNERYFDGSEYSETVHEIFQKMLCIMHTLESADENTKTTIAKMLDEHINLIIVYLKYLGLIKEEDKE